MNSYILPDAFQQSTSYIKVRQELVHTHVAASIRCDGALAIMQEGANCAQRYVTLGEERVTEDCRGQVLGQWVSRRMVVSRSSRTAIHTGLSGHTQSARVCSSID